MGRPLPARSAATTAHTPSWVRPTAPTPRIFPSMRCQGFIAEMMTSTTRLVFSSSVARITETAYRRITM